MAAPARHLRAAGRWLTAGAVIWVAALAFHPPPPSDVDGFMRLIAETGTRWVAVHWLAAISLSVFAIVGLLVLTAQSRLTENALGLSAWALLVVASLWVATTAVTEATAISHVAASGDAALFEAFHLFAEGQAMGFIAIALAVAMIAWNEIRQHADAATPAWVASIGLVAGLLGFVAWILGPLLGLAIGGLLFVLSSLVFGLFLIWFGVGIARTPGPGPHPHAQQHAQESRPL